MAFEHFSKLSWTMLTGTLTLHSDDVWKGLTRAWVKSKKQYLKDVYFIQSNGGYDLIMISSTVVSVSSGQINHPCATVMDEKVKM